MLPSAPLQPAGAARGAGGSTAPRSPMRQRATVLAPAWQMGGRDGGGAMGLSARTGILGGAARRIRMAAAAPLAALVAAAKG